MAFRFKPLDQLAGNGGTQSRVKDHFAEEAGAQPGNFLGPRTIVHVHILIDLPPPIALGKRARVAGVHFRPGNNPGLQFRQDLLETLQVEFVLQAGAPGFQEDRKIFIGQDGLQQFLRPQTA